MHRIWIDVNDIETWYKIIQEANQYFGHRNWKGQPRVKSKFRSYLQTSPYNIWFSVPDLKFASWIAIKLSVVVTKITSPME